MRKIYFLLLFLCLAVNMQARERTVQEMKRIALNQLGLSSSSTRSNATTEVRKMYDADMLAVYGTESAFVVVSKDTEFAPVLGYSDAPFVADNMPTDFLWWMAQITASMKRGYQSNYSPATRSTGDGSYLVTARWGQTSPYSDACPSYTGCVATAMSQIMYYYKYPAQGEGTDCAYTVNGTDNARSFSTTYAWDKMVDDYYHSTLFISKPRKKAVADLMFDAGSAVHMQYTNTGSGAYTNDAAAAFVKNFHYDSLSVNLLSRFLYSDQEWMNIISNEIQNKRPILYAASDTVAGGHAFIFDGIDDNGLVHINWGWDGSANGFYNIADLSPNDTILSTDDHYHFNLGQQMIIGLKAHTNADTEDSYHSQWCSDSVVAYSTPGKDSLGVEIANLYNMDYQDFSGEILLLLISQTQKDTTAVSLIDIPKDTKSTVPYGSGFTFRNNEGKVEVNYFDLKKDLGMKAGNYKVCLASRSDRQAVPTVLRVMGGESSSLFTYSADGMITFNTSTGISDIQQISPTSKDNSVRVYDETGKLVYVSSPETFRIDNIRGHGLFIIKQGTRTRKVIR